MSGLQTVPPSNFEPGSAAPQAMQVQVFSPLPVFDAVSMKKRMKAIQEVKKSVMVKGIHFDTVPGGRKDSLLKPGAEVLCQVFGLIPIIEHRPLVDDPDVEWSWETIRKNHDTGENYTDEGTGRGHYEVEAICTLYTMNGAIAGRASAICSSRENKYRTLSVYDVKNTVIQMAGKRAHVSITRTATGCSDLFDMDTDDMTHGVQGSGSSRASMVATGTPNLSPKQQEKVRSTAKSHGVSAQVAEFTIARVTKVESRAFMDTMFSGDATKIAAAFEPYAAALRASQSEPQQGHPAAADPGPEAPQGAPAGKE